VSLALGSVVWYVDNGAKIKGSVWSLAAGRLKWWVIPEGEGTPSRAVLVKRTVDKTTGAYAYTRIDA
jgi:hypothetical protein